MIAYLSDHGYLLMIAYLSDHGYLLMIVYLSDHGYLLIIAYLSDHGGPLNVIALLASDSRSSSSARFCFVSPASLLLEGVIELEGFTQKRVQRSSLLFGGQNWFNSMPHCTDVASG